MLLDAECELYVLELSSFQLETTSSLQAVAATIGYATLRYLGEQHLRDCIRVVQQAQLRLPPPASASAVKH